MNSQIIFDASRPDADIIALAENGKIAEFLAERKGKRSLVGDVYSAVVQKISPNKFAFIDIGAEKSAFVYLNDTGENADLKQGQTVLAQISKDATGAKGAVCTTSPSFSGMYCVLLKTLRQRADEISISRKIEDANERKRLTAIVRKSLPKGFSAIVRTKSEQVSESALLEDLSILQKLFDLAENEWRHEKPPKLVHRAPSFLERAFTELYTPKTDKIVTNSAQYFSTLCQIKEAKKLSVDIEFYDETQKMLSLFDAYGAKKTLETSLSKTVWLQCGGFLIIEKTEACHVVDVNSGKFVGKKSEEETALTVNLEAARAIARQMRLRNISGIVIVDFIDMRRAESKQAVTQTLQEAVKADRIGVTVVGMTELGLMQLTRKKIREPLSAILNPHKE